MKTNNLSHVEYVAPKSINRNIELGNLYRIPSNYDEIKNNTKSDEPLTNNGVSNIIWLYVIHKDDDTKFNKEKVNEYKFVDFLLYNKYINISLPII